MMLLQILLGLILLGACGLAINRANEWLGARGIGLMAEWGLAAHIGVASAIAFIFVALALGLHQIGILT